jgi:hypothetical protein
VSSKTSKQNRRREGTTGVEKKTADAIIEETYREIEKMLDIILRDVNSEGKDDLEALENFIRNNMHNLGRIILEKYLNMSAVRIIKQKEVSGYVHQAKYMEIREKEVMTVLGKIRLKRGYYYDSESGKGYCPKDKDLGIEGISFSPGVQRMMARTGSNRPFSLSEEDILELAGLDINAKAIERNCHRLGEEAEEYIKQITVENERTGKEVMYLSMDGTGVPVVKEETEGRKGKCENGRAKTREAKLGCIFTQTEMDENNRPARQEGSTTYVGAIETAEDFGRRVNAEATRRGIQQAKKICVIGDGAPWIWNIAKEYFWNATQIIDLYHAREHYWDCARLFFSSKSKRLNEWTEKRKKELDSGKVEAVIRAIQRLDPKTEEQKQVCKSSIHYFTVNKKRMRYDKFRARGLFVGSGIIEAGCRTVIGQRLKQSGMHWTVSGANSIMALRCIQRSNRWEDFWEYKAAA